MITVSAPPAVLMRAVGSNLWGTKSVGHYTNGVALGMKAPPVLDNYGAIIYVTRHVEGLSTTFEVSTWVFMHARAMPVNEDAEQVARQTRDWTRKSPLGGVVVRVVGV